MKRFACFFFTFALLLTLTACVGSSQDAELLGKYGHIINDLENKNYQNAIDKIESLAAEDSANDSDSQQPTLSTEQLTWQKNILGTWFPDKTATEDGHTGFTINEDGTCVLDENTYAWTIDYASESSASITITEENITKYSLSFSTNSEYGYKTASLSVYMDENSITGTMGLYYCQGDYNKVQITDDNWQEYFEVKELTATQINSFNEVDGFRGHSYLRLKDSLGKINPYVSSVAAEYKGISLCQDITVDLEKLTYVPVGDVHNTSDYESTTELSTSRDCANNWYYGTSLGSFILSNVDKELTGTVWRPTDIEILRVRGTIYIIK